MTACRHLEPSPEAYAVDAFGRTTRTELQLCCWPDQNPERLVDAPRWLLRLVGGGLAVKPDRDCVGCPGFLPGPDTPG